MVIYINKHKVIEDFIKENSEYEGKKLTVNITKKSYSIKYGKQLLLNVQAIDENIFKEVSNIYGYCRVSTKTQNITRQFENILKEYPTAKVYQEAITGRKIEGRKELEKLLKVVQSGDSIVFDSVSRMSRNAEEGTELYFKLFERGINLVFLKEAYINTSTYQKALENKISLIGTKEDILLNAINEYLKELAKEQIKIAFEQSQKEVDDLRQRTREGLRVAKNDGKRIGTQTGDKFHIKKKAPLKNDIRRMSKDFEGTYKDIEVIKFLDISKNTYYKYKKELANEINNK